MLIIHRAVVSAIDAVFGRASGAVDRIIDEIQVYLFFDFVVKWQELVD